MRKIKIKNNLPPNWATKLKIEVRTLTSVRVLFLFIRKVLKKDKKKGHQKRELRKSI